MGNKARKVFSKFLMVLPFALLVSFIMTGLSDYGTALIFGIVLSGLLIFVNVIDYDKHDELQMSEYLELKHEVNIDYEPVVWSRIQDIFANQLDNKAELTENRKDRIQVSLNSNLLKPEVIAERRSDKILLGIRNRYLKFIPDNARNYRMLRRLEKRIKTPANTV